MPRGLLVAAVLLFSANGLVGQSMIWAGYGQNSDRATGVVAGEHVSIGYILARPSAGAAAMLGLPMDQAVGTRWGTVSGWVDRPLGTTRWRAHAGGSVFAFDDRVIEDAGAGSVISLDVERPLWLAPVEVRLRVGARHGWRARAGESDSRPLGRAGVDGAVRAGRVVASTALDHWRAEEGGYTQAAVRAGLYERRVQVWGGVARWLHDDLPGTGWDLGTRLVVTDRVSIIARGGVQVADILFWIPRQRAWSLGVQVRTGTSPVVATLPVPVVRDDRRAITLTLPDDDDDGRAAPPAVAGSFSDWQPITMRRGDDRWEVEVVLEPGVHEYAFVTADGTWFVPEETPGRKPDGFGGHVAVVIVE